MGSNLYRTAKKASLLTLIVFSLLLIQASFYVCSVKAQADSTFYDTKLDNSVDNDDDGYFGSVDIGWDANTELTELTVVVKILARIEGEPSHFSVEYGPYTIYGDEVDWQYITISDGVTGLWYFKLELYDNATSALLDTIDYGEGSGISGVPMDENDAVYTYREYFHENGINFTPFDSDDDGYNDALEVKMNVDVTDNGNLTIQVYAFLVNQTGTLLVDDLDRPQWQVMDPQIVQPQEQSYSRNLRIQSCWYSQ